MTLNNRKRPDGFKNVTTIAKRDVLVWTDATGKPRHATADKGATKLNLHTARLSRQAAKYQHRRHYEGYYWFARTGKHVWYESMTEYTALMWLDYQHPVRAIAAQPMCIFFADGTRHYPDFFSVHDDGSQVLYDVRPLERIDEKAAVQFGKTRELCKKTGWRYEVFAGVHQVVRHNLEWLAAYRHQRCSPDGVLSERVLSFLTEARPLADVLRLLDLKSPARYLPQLYHMMWTRHICFDIAQPLSPATPIWKA
ncbi:TnsA-like heteromeric transposase endonuclease subunit [Cryobacterium tagatosivorans]|uniref:TnsA-like heteromeric transposase endonuclease subunit n=1 Tax=Cryobacterium tagatosivorans TaxID=1259199 RepID=A0A4R8UAL9_9MICO|nr:TnsA-like heteromeric transposase endonuclease subunit [Cryobacterium tagatosivorans]TFB47265.1 TnsA-like heteromeric transposase endonuclease subunit [Cryobacterium tagatosivorans]